tara:strand:+ start:5114 stop:5602 length:489 start_codon:yes stop_codon:yes gene_type:complete
LARLPLVGVACLVKGSPEERVRCQSGAVALTAIESADASRFPRIMLLSVMMRCDDKTSGVPVPGNHTGVPCCVPGNQRDANFSILITMHISLSVETARWFVRSEAGTSVATASVAPVMLPVTTLLGLSRPLLRVMHLQITGSLKGREHEHTRTSMAITHIRL